MHKFSTRSFRKCTSRNSRTNSPNQWPIEIVCTHEDSKLRPGGAYYQALGPYQLSQCLGDKTNKYKYKSVKKSYLTWTPPMQKSTISTHTNQEDIKKYNSNRNADAMMTKNIAPFALISRTSLSRSSNTVSALEDSYSMKENTISSKNSSL